MRKVSVISEHKFCVQIILLVHSVMKAILRIGCNKYSGEIGMCTSVNRVAILNTRCFACTDARLTRQISIASLCVTVANGL